MLHKCPVSRAATRMSVTSKASAIALPCRRAHRRTREARRVISMAGSEDVVSSYASALASLAESEDKLKEIHSDMNRLSTIIQDAEELPEFLGSSIVDEGERKEVLATVCRDAGFREETENFLNLVMDKGRAGLLHEICESFEDHYCQLTGTQVVVLTSAYQLEEDEQYEIAKKLQQLSGAKNIKLKPVLDPIIIGGFIVEFGSSQIDLSIKGQLSRIGADLRERVANA